MSAVIQVILWIAYMFGGTAIIIILWNFIEAFNKQKRLADLFLTFKDFEKYFYLNPEQYFCPQTCIRRKYCDYYIGFKNPFDYIFATNLVKDYQNNKEKFRKQQRQKEYLRNYLEMVQEDINELQKEVKEETNKAKKLLNREKQMEEHRKEMFKKLLNQPLDENIVEKYLNNYFDEYK